MDGLCHQNLAPLLTLSTLVAVRWLLSSVMMKKRKMSLALESTTAEAVLRVVALMFVLALPQKTAQAWPTSPTATSLTSTAHRLQQRRRRLPAVSLAAEAGSSSDQKKGTSNDDDDYDVPKYHKPRFIDESLLGDLTGGRPGAIIETTEQLETKDKMFAEMEDGTRNYPKWMNRDYGELAELEEAEYDIGDDPNAIDASTLGTWTIFDLESQFDYEWHPLTSKEPDPNLVAMNQPGVRYLQETEKDDDGVEIGYDPVFGPSNPIDKRTILGTKDSYMIDETTRDDSMLTPQFLPDDPEIKVNQDFVKFRKSLDIMETYIDPFLPQDMEIPRHQAKWHGYPEPTHFEPQNFTNNRFTADEDRTDFDSMSPHRARQRAVELARSNNAEWLPKAKSHEWHQSQREPYEAVGTLVGTLRKGEVDEDIRKQIQPALDILGSIVELLSITQINGSGKDGTDDKDVLVFRFHYHGLMKNKFGMQCWTETLLQECGVPVTGVIFETGFRRRDPAYDGGDPYYGYSG